MKKLLLSMFAVALLAGCATQLGTFQNVAGKFLTSSALTVDTAMKGTALLAVQGAISTNDWAQVSAYYGQYQVAMSIATNAYNLAVMANDPNLFAPASNRLFSAQSALTSKTTTLSPVK